MSNAHLFRFIGEAIVAVLEGTGDEALKAEVLGAIESYRDVMVDGVDSDEEATALRDIADRAIAMIRTAVAASR